MGFTRTEINVLIDHYEYEIWQLESRFDHIEGIYDFDDDLKKMQLDRVTDDIKNCKARISKLEELLAKL